MILFVHFLNKIHQTIIFVAVVVVADVAAFAVVDASVCPIFIIFNAINYLFLIFNLNINVYRKIISLTYFD